jgi:hypothetical protein
MAVAFCAHWLEGVGRLSSGERTTERVSFIDGPFRVDLKRASAESVELSLVNFCRGEVVEHLSEQTIRTLLQDAVQCGQSVLDSANEHDWADDHDIQSLGTAVIVANSLLSA